MFWIIWINQCWINLHIVQYGLKVQVFCTKVMCLDFHIKRIFKLWNAFYLAVHVKYFRTANMNVKKKVQSIYWVTEKMCF